MTVTLLFGDQARAAAPREWAWYAGVLAEPRLVEGAVVPIVGGVAFGLAVPVGGRRGRRGGGFLAMDSIADASAVRTALATLPGFPRVRARWSPYADVAHNVAWGCEPLSHDHRVLGRLYGYRDEAIQDYYRRVQVTAGGSSTFGETSAEATVIPVPEPLLTSQPGLPMVGGQQGAMIGRHVLGGCWGYWVPICGFCRRSLGAAARARAGGTVVNASRPAVAV